jgi:hypothetical protein
MSFSLLFEIILGLGRRGAAVSGVAVHVPLWSAFSAEVEKSDMAYFDWSKQPHLLNCALHVTGVQKLYLFRKAIRQFLLLLFNEHGFDQNCRESEGSKVGVLQR